MFSDTTKVSLLSFFLGSIGQLIGRIFYMNGSLDKIWLMLFALPPITIIPSIWFFMDWVEKGAGGSVFNMFTYIIPVISIVLTSILSYAGANVTEWSAASIAILISNVVTYTIARFMQYQETCKIQKKELYDKNYPAQYIIKSIVYSLVTFSSIFIAGKAIIPILRKIPPTRMMLGLIDTGEYYLPGLSMGTTLLLFHTINQMYGNTPGYQDVLCKNMLESWKM